MTYDPNDLDPAFAEVAAAMSAKFDELARDKWVEVHSEMGGYEDVGPLKGWAKDPFFDPAVALSGQDLGLIGALYDVITEVWTQTDDDVARFREGMGQALGKWSGTASIDCAQYVGSLEDFIHNERDSLFTLARGLVTYAAIIKRSRESLDELMHKCVEGWNQAGHANEAANLSVAIAALTAVSGIGFTIITGGAGAVTLPAFGMAVTGVAGSITNNAANLHGKSDEIATTFLREAQNLLGGTADAIDHTARPDLDRARDILPHLPPLPGGITDKGKFYPEHGSPGSGPPSKISKALG